MICYYHRADLDGQCSGAIIKQTFPNCRMVGVDYGDDCQEMVSMADDGEEIIVVDFCFEPFTWMEVLASRGGLTWLDHHKTAIEASDKSDINIFGKREIGSAACELTWEYYRPGIKMPLSVHYLGRFDVWDWKDRDEPIREFQLGMGIHATQPGDKIWDEVLFTPKDDLTYERTNTVDRIVSDGEAIQGYLVQQNEFLVKEGSFETTIDGHRAIVLNTPIRGSHQFDAIQLEENYPVMAVYCYLGDGKWRYSLYSDSDVDVGAIASEYGGGGHSGAAGFQTTAPVFS